MFRSSHAVGVVILGAGASVRMGQPKLLLPWKQTTVLGHLIQQWQTLKARQIAVVTRRADRPMALELRRLHCPKLHRVKNPDPDRGMFSSIVCAARWLGWDGCVTAWAIVLGDQPHLRQKTLRALLACHRTHVDAICQPVFDGHRGHPVVLPRDAFAELAQTSAQTLREFLNRTRVPQIECPVADSGLSLDLDYPEDYRKLCPKTTNVK
jgi:molybdenum cofactor cytidylyltransferase